VQAKAQGCGVTTNYCYLPTGYGEEKWKRVGFFKCWLSTLNCFQCMGGTLIFGNQTPSQREGSFTHMEGITPNIGWKNPLYNSVIGGIENQKTGTHYLTVEKQSELSHCWCWWMPGLKAGHPRPQAPFWMVATLATSQNPLKKTLFVAAGDAHRKNERWDKIQFPSRPPWMRMYVLGGFLNLIPCMTKLKVLVLCFPYG
jgi:hypothetical protein